MVWVDLLKPTPGEIAAVEEGSGLTLPSQEELSEIELSSRLRTDGDVLFLSAPLVSPLADAGSRDDPGRLRAGARAAGHGAL